MKSASAEMGKLTPFDLLKPFWPLYGVASSPQLQTLARNFVEPQQERHRADYDLSRPFTRAEAEYLIGQARDALDNWNTLKINDRELARFYALCLLNWNNWKGRQITRPARAVCPSTTSRPRTIKRPANRA